VPQEYSSGERQRRGHLLRSAHPQLQSLLVQAALRMSHSTDPRTATLRAWAEAIGRRRGKKIAMVALARRLARILFAMWRDQTDYQPKGFRVRQPNPVSEMTSDTRTAARR
jgi:transposase